VRLPTLAELKNHAGLSFVAGAMVLFGYVLRRQNLGFPKVECWDEEHFVRNARAYLGAGLDLNDHPPLGKLLVAAGMKVFGDDSFGWRIVPMCFGVVAIVVAWMLAAELFKSWRAGALAAAFVAVDGFFIAYSRTALLDGMLTTLIMASALLLVQARSHWRILAACAALGFAASIKFTGVVLLPAVLWVTLSGRRVPRWSAVYLLAGGLVYYLCFAAGLRMLQLPSSPWAVAKATHGLLSHHLVLTDMTHPATSHWYTWWLPTRPIVLHFEQSRGWVRALTTLGNPVLWWAGTLAVAAAAASLGARILQRLRGQGSSDAKGFFASHQRAATALLGFWVLPLLPWVLTRRDSYIYHYLPSYAFALILLAGFGAWLYERRSTLVLAALIVVAELSVFYAPVWGQLPLSQTAYEQRLFLERWR
jgi:dolichyl-phosphate-mannose--protein O-mannosyl transferase